MPFCQKLNHNKNSKSCTSIILNSCFQKFNHPFISKQVENKELKKLPNIERQKISLKTLSIYPSSETLLIKKNNQHPNPQNMIQKKRTQKHSRICSYPSQTTRYSSQIINESYPNKNKRFSHKSAQESPFQQKKPWILIQKHALINPNKFNQKQINWSYNIPTTRNCPYINESRPMQKKTVYQLLQDQKLHQKQLFIQKSVNWKNINFHKQKLPSQTIQIKSNSIQGKIQSYKDSAIQIQIIQPSKVKQLSDNQSKTQLSNNQSKKISIKNCMTLNNQQPSFLNIESDMKQVKSTVSIYTDPSQQSRFEESFVI